MPDTGHGRRVIEQDYDFVVYVDTNDANKVKAKAGDKETVEFSHASDLANVLNSIHATFSSTSGGTVGIKSGSYGWGSVFAVTKKHVAVIGNPGVVVTQTSATNTITVENELFQLENIYWNLSGVGNGNGSWIVAGSTTNSNHGRIYNNYVESPGTHGIDLEVNASGWQIAHNQIQNFQNPTGDAIRCINNADCTIMANGLGGFFSATNGYGFRSSAAINLIISQNRIFVNRIGALLYAGRGIIFANNFIQSCTNHGLVIQNDTATTFGRTIVTGNRIHDNGTATPNTYDGIRLSLSSTGGLNNVVIADNMCSDQDTTVANKNQRYGIVVNSNLLTDSIITNNACAGNRTGAILRGTIDPTCKIFSNTGDTIPYSFQDFSEERIVTAPTDPASGFLRRYAKQVDTNNDGLFYKTKVNGAVVEVAL